MADANIAAIQKRRLFVSHRWSYLTLLPHILLRLTTAGPARDCIFGRPGNGGDEFLVGRIGIENSVVPPEPQDDDAIGYCTHVLQIYG